MNSWSLESVKAGDLLLISSHFRSDDKLLKVDRITKTQVVIGNNKYRISDGRAIGYGGEWNIPRASIPTDEQIENIQFSQNKKMLIEKLQKDQVTKQQVHDMLILLGVK